MRFDISVITKRPAKPEQLRPSRPAYDKESLHDAGCGYRHGLTLRDSSRVAHAAVVSESEENQTPQLSIWSPKGGAIEMTIAPPGECYSMVHTMVALTLPRPEGGDLVLVGGYCNGDVMLRIFNPWAQSEPIELRGHQARPTGAALVWRRERWCVASVDEGGELLTWAPDDASMGAWRLASRAKLMPAEDRTVGNCTPTLCVGCGNLVATIDTVLANEDGFGYEPKEGPSWQNPQRSYDAKDARPVVSVQFWDVDGELSQPVRTVLLDAPQSYGPRVTAAVFMANSSPPRLVLSILDTVISLAPVAPTPAQAAEVASTRASLTPPAGGEGGMSNQDFRSRFLPTATASAPAAASPSPGPQWLDAPELSCELLSVDVSTRLLLVPWDEPRNARLVVLSDHIDGYKADVLDVTATPRRCGALELRKPHRWGSTGTGADEYFKSGVFLPDGRLLVVSEQMCDDGPKLRLGGRYWDDSLSPHGVARLFKCASVHGVSFEGATNFFGPSPGAASQDSSFEDELISRLPSMPMQELEETYRSTMTDSVHMLGLPADLADKMLEDVYTARHSEQGKIMLVQTTCMLEQAMTIREGLEKEGRAAGRHGPKTPAATEARPAVPKAKPAASGEAAFVVDDPRALGLRKGDKVKLHSLVSRSDLNGCATKIIGPFERESGRFPVRVTCIGECIKVKPANVELTKMHMDDTTCDFVRPGGGIEEKDVYWCRTNGIEQVGATVWAGDWWDEMGEEARALILARGAAHACRHRSSGWADSLNSDDDDDDDDSSDPGNFDSDDDCLELVSPFKAGMSMSLGGRSSSTEFGFSQDELEELACQGIKPWEPEAAAAVHMLFPARY